MSKFESNPDIKKLDATQLDINFENTPNNSNVEEEKKDIIGTDTGEEEKPGDEYYGRFNEYINEKTPPSPKKQKTQREKDDDKIRAIKKAIEKGKDKERKTGYEHSDPWDMSR